MRCERPLSTMTRHVVVTLAAAAAVGVGACDPAGISDDDEAFEPAIAVPDCRPNNDGVIEASELPVVVGATARVRVGENIPVDVEGTVDDQGLRVWDLTRPNPDDQPIGALSVEPMDGQYFEDLFPEADVAAPLVPGGSLLGPLRVDDDGWKLLGGMSATEDPNEGQTRIVYDTPTVLYPFPLREGSRVTSTSRARNALLVGIPTAFDDITEVEVIRRGTVLLPDLILDNTLQVRVRFTRTLLAGDVKQVSYLFVHECLGEVARFVSEAVPVDDDLDEALPIATEVWRLAL
jgi:hypothetical protein